MPVECAHAVSVRITRPNKFLAFAPLKQHGVRVWIRRAFAVEEKQKGKL